jgi:hypothetical protein
VFDGPKLFKLLYSLQPPIGKRAKLYHLAP